MYLYVFIIFILSGLYASSISGQGNFLYLCSCVSANDETGGHEKNQFHQIMKNKF